MPVGSTFFNTQSNTQVVLVRLVSQVSVGNILFFSADRIIVYFILLCVSEGEGVLHESGYY